MESLDKIIDLINKENYFSRELTDDEKKIFFNIYLLTTDTKNVDERFIYLQDKYLSELYGANKRLFDVKSRSVNAETVLDIETDLLVVFSHNLLVDGEDLMRSSESAIGIDNKLICRGGLQVRSEFYNLLEDDGFVISYTNPYLVNGYNLPAKNVAKLMYDNKLDLEEIIEKLSKNLENLVVLIKNMDIDNCVVVFDSLPNDIKNDKKFKKYIKNTLKIAKIKIFFAEN